MLKAPCEPNLTSVKMQKKTLLLLTSYYERKRYSSVVHHKMTQTIWVSFYNINNVDTNMNCLSTKTGNKSSQNLWCIKGN